MERDSDTQEGTVVRVFPDRSQLERAIMELKAAGFLDDQIGVLAHHTESLEGGIPATDEGTASSGQL